MEIVATLLKQIAIMTIILLVGLALFRTKKLTSTGMRDVSQLLIYIVMPCTVMNSFLTEYSAERLQKLALSFLLSGLALGLSMLVSRILFARHPIEQFGSAFSNAGFIGIPLVQAVLGAEAVFYVSPLVALLNILQWTYGVYVITRDKSQISLKKVLTNPVLIGLLLGILAFLAPVEIPTVISGSISMMSNLNAPLAMLCVGTYLAQLPFKSILMDRTAYFSTVVRLLLIPGLTLALFCVLPIQDLTMKLTILIAAATPVGSNVAVFAQLHNKNYTQAVKSICLSTFFSIFTIPVVLAVAVGLFGAG